MKKKLANWGNYPVMEAEECSFLDAAQLPELLSSRPGAIARGMGRCYGDAALASHSISTLRYDKILSFNKEAGVLECQSGITLDQVLQVIVPAGWFLPVTPGTKFITVGGAVASDVHGKNHHVDGSFSRHVEEIDLVTADGQTLTCSPYLLSDLFWATCGGMGLTGIIIRVRFRLKKINTAFIRQKQIKAANLDEVLHLFEQYDQYTYSVAWIDCLKKGKHFGRSILMLGEHAEVAELPKQLQERPLAQRSNRQLRFPFYLPSWMLNNFTVRTFNHLFYLKNTRREINNIVPYEPFFYPLDTITDWNKGYGRKGFVQYQFVLPLTSRDGLSAILRRISEKGWGSFLAVLKVFGAQNDLIAFPTEGYTLALDFPMRKGLLAFLDELDALVLQYGGRIYLSKDARMDPGVFQKGYARAAEFVSILDKYNPKGTIRSAQAERLHIIQ